MSTPDWHILFRGSLSSCNYACSYCPFAKTTNSPAEIAKDARELGRFVDWVEQQPQRIGVLFTPWGEALIHKSYQQAISRLSHMPNVSRVAIQTNFACGLEWTRQANLERLALWTTYHPNEVALDKFLTKCEDALQRGVRFSVGVVGHRDAFSALKELRNRLDPNVYLWINAWKREPDYYTAEELAWLTEVDPLFPFNAKPHSSLGKACRSGHTAFTVDGQGDARRCHFIPTKIGNIYDDDFSAKLSPKPCSNAECRCHIGYVHMPDLELYEAFGEGILERFPSRLPPAHWNRWANSDWAK